jgi:hypothetical protein
MLTSRLFYPWLTDHAIRILSNLVQALWASRSQKKRAYLLAAVRPTRRKRNPDSGRRNPLPGCSAASVGVLRRSVESSYATDVKETLRDGRRKQRLPGGLGEIIATKISAS